jgi:hypothetical protein
MPESRIWQKRYFKSDCSMAGGSDSDRRREREINRARRHKSTKVHTDDRKSKREAYNEYLNKLEARVRDRQALRQDLETIKSRPQNDESIVTNRNSKFRKEGDDLVTNVRITVKEAFYGWSRNVETFHGPILNASRSGPTIPGYFQSFLGYGLLNAASGVFGNLKVLVTILYPDNWSPRKKNMIEELLSELSL